jgi:hypothetical protein
LDVLLNSGLLEDLVLVKEENEVGVGRFRDKFLYLENMMVVFICSLVVGKGAKHTEEYSEWSDAFVEAGVLAITSVFTLESNLFVGFIDNDVQEFCCLES